MSAPTFSLFGSCIRPRFWPRILDALDKNAASYELVFRGNVKPEVALPERCRWTYDEGSAIECWERASRECAGRLVSLWVDDYDLSPGGLDAILERWSGDPLHVVSPRYVLGGEDRTDWQMRFVPRDLTSPALPLGGFFERDFYLSLGGADRRFAGVAADVDISMRAVCERGARVEFSDVAIVNERREWQPPGYVSLSERCERTDHALLKSLWERTGDVWRRTSAVELIP